MNSMTELKLTEALKGLADDQPFTPDVTGVERRGRRRRLRGRVAGAGTALAAAGVVAAVALGGSQPPAPQALQPSLTTLADSVLASGAPAGDATFVLRTQRILGRDKTDAEVFADDGAYYFSRTPGDIGQEIADHHDRANGVFQREVAAAETAATGDLEAARQQMSDAPLDPGQHGPAVSDDVMSNWIWTNSMDALIAGGGRPQVRAGVLRLLDTLDTVEVTRTTTGGRPTLTLTADAGDFPEMTVGQAPRAYQEQLVVGASDGVPVAFTGGEPGAAPSVMITYRVSRVTLDEVAGKS